MRVLLAVAVLLVFAPSAHAQVPACPVDSPAAMQMTGLPSVAVPGRSYTLALESTGSGAARGGLTLGVHDRHGVGWSARYDSLGVSQEFSVGLTGAPFTVTADYTEVTAAGTCARTLSASLPIERRVLAVINCRRGAVEPRSGLVLRCDGERVRLSGLTWSGWNSDVVRGQGVLRGRRVSIKLSRPVECSTVDGFIYSRATVDGKRIPVDCPID
jgi:hypothetical protein